MTTCDATVLAILATSIAVIIGFAAFTIRWARRFAEKVLRMAEGD